MPPDTLCKPAIPLSPGCVCMRVAMCVSIPPSSAIMKCSAQLHYGAKLPLAGGNMKLGSVQAACQYRFPYPHYLLQKNRAVCAIIEQVNSLSHKMETCIDSEQPGFHAQRKKLVKLYRLE